MTYICPKTGETYTPSQVQASDAPDLIWARCTRCSAKGQTASELGVETITSGGQWHVERRGSLLWLMMTAGATELVRRAFGKGKEMAVGQ